MENFIGEVERAIEVSIADVEPQIRSQASAFLDNVRTMPDAWKMALTKLLDVTNDSTVFFYFQLLEDLFKFNRSRFPSRESIPTLFSHLESRLDLPFRL